MNDALLQRLLSEILAANGYDNYLLIAVKNTAVTGLGNQVALVVEGDPVKLDCALGVASCRNQDLGGVFCIALQAADQEAAQNN